MIRCGEDYAIVAKGSQLLQDFGISPEEKPYTPAEIHSISYVEHDLQVNALVLDIAHRARSGEGPLLDAMPFKWHGPRSGEIDPRKEQRPAEVSDFRSRLTHFFHGSSREGVLKLRGLEAPRTSRARRGRAMICGFFDPGLREASVSPPGVCATAV